MTPLLPVTKVLLPASLLQQLKGLCRWTEACLKQTLLPTLLRGALTWLIEASLRHAQVGSWCWSCVSLC